MRIRHILNDKSSQGIGPADGLVEIADTRYSGGARFGTVVIIDHGDELKTFTPVWGASWSSRASTCVVKNQSPRWGRPESPRAHTFTSRTGRVATR